MSIWDDLGIAPTADSAAIRRAYAARMKQCRPEEDRERFMRLREAYEKALAGEGDTKHSALEPQWEESVARPLPSQAGAQPQPPEIFQFGRVPIPAPRIRLDIPPPAPVSGSRLSKAATRILPPWRDTFDSACARRDVEAAMAEFDRLRSEDGIGMSDTIYCTDQLLRLLSRDEVLPLSRLKEIAERFGWYPSTGANNAPLGSAHQKLLKRLDAEFWQSTVRERAEAGDVQMQFRLGVSYDREGISDEERTEALRWLELAARQGHGRAQAHMGKVCEKGIGRTQDFEQAVYWYRESLNNGFTVVAADLANLLHDGKGAPQDYSEARRLYQIGIHGLDGTSDFNRNRLAKLLRNGLGGSVDAAGARELFEESARSNNLFALVSLGDMLAKGEGGPKEDALAAKWYRIAAEAGNMAGQFKLGVRYLAGKGVEKDRQLAQDWLRKAHAQDHIEAGYTLAYSLMHYGGSISEQAEAVLLFAALAEKGVSKAQFELGGAYRDGRGVQADFEIGLAWYLRAAQNGHVTAMNHLGYALLHGKRVQQDVAKAWYWLTRAAEGGQPDAMHTVGSIFEAGQIVKQDLVRACLWYKLAAANYRASIGKLDEVTLKAKAIGAELPPELLARIEAEIAVFNPKDWSPPKQV